MLVRRLLELKVGIPERAVRFDAPLRVRARSHRGSDLLNPSELARLCTWGRPDLAPDLVVVLVDRDGDGARRAAMEATVSELGPPPVVVGVAEEEFEAWLLTDVDAVHAAVGAQPPASGAAEAKGWLEGLLTQKVRDVDERIRGAKRRELRKQIAGQMDLEHALKTNSSLGRLVENLVEVGVSLPGGERR